jgi:hypothetical protein
LVLDTGGQREVLEVKLTTAPNAEDLSRLAKVADMVGAKRSVLISRTTQPVFSKNRWSLDLATYLRASAKAT